MKARLPQGYGGGPKNQNQMMQQIQKMQDDMAKTQEELEQKEYEISSGGGAVKLVISGKKEIKSIDLAPEIVDPDDIDMLSDLIIAAVNEGIRKVDEESSTAMSAITGGINIPGIF